jgi:hypothetical protein
MPPATTLHICGFDRAKQHRTCSQRPSRKALNYSANDKKGFAGLQQQQLFCKCELSDAIQVSWQGRWWQQASAGGTKGDGKPALH